MTVYSSCTPYSCASTFCASMLLLSACFLFFPLPHLSRVMVPLFIHAVACRILPIRLVSKLKFLLRSRAVIPLRPLLTCWGFQTAEYNFCCSPDCPQPSFFHEYSLFSWGWMLVLVISLIICIRKLSSGSSCDYSWEGFHFMKCIAPNYRLKKFE